MDLTLCDWLCHVYGQLSKLGAGRLVLLSGESSQMWGTETKKKHSIGPKLWNMGLDKLHMSVHSQSIWDFVRDSRKRKSRKSNLVAQIY